MTTKRYEWMRRHIERTGMAERFPEKHQIQLVNRQGEWLATLVGDDADALQERAQRMSSGIRGSRVVNPAA
ncbi:hypothetical protein [Chromohalobacter sp. 296-RDG]|uniref:hypothetical protein n=1 Tax=Chromohalobacter sp. 296-RDG TaxID=2994062 RepID=UPI0024685BC9|nr:hypothetical protein [Chromohalobacter sp. 296-RDG]